MADDSKISQKKHITFSHVLKIVLWCVMGLILFVAGILMGVVNILKPARLTPIVEKLATQSLINSRVEIESVELSVMKSFPFLQAEITDLTLISTVTDSLDSDTREMLPAWTDTVATVKGFKGGLNLMGLISNKLDFSDVTIDSPAANIVIIDEETSNIDILPPSDPDAEPFDIKKLPNIHLTRFEIVNPGDLRYFDFNSGTDIAVGFSQIDFIGAKAPLYTLDFDGELKVPSELLDIFNLDDIKFGLNGDLVWDQSKPMALELNNFRYMLSLISGTVNTSLDFNNQFKIKSLELNVDPISVARAISIIPDDIAEEFGIPKDITTDATIALSAHLLKPWILGSDNLPAIKLNVNIPKSTLSWNRLVLDNLMADISFVNPGNNLNESSVEINNLVLKGPATDLTIKGRLTNLAPIPNPEASEDSDDSFTFDPLFDGTCDGTCDLSRIPPFLRNLIPGVLSGRVTTHVSLRGSPSMFNADSFHRLKIKGDLTVNDLYFLSNDTVNMFSVDRLLFKFGTDESVVREKFKADSLLRLTCEVDTATIVHSDIEMGLSGLSLGLSTANRAGSAKRDKVNGAGGNMSLKAFNMTKANDSILVRIRNVNGYTAIVPHHENVKIPRFIFDLKIGGLVTGNPENRLMIRNAATHIDAFPQPPSRRARAIAATADSIHRALPHLSADSVVALAIERHRPKRYHRVHPVFEDSTETIDWGTSSLLKKILVGWKINVNVSSDRGAFFTPYFPLRNRLRHLDLALNNDSLIMNGLEYKIGHSDFLINGVVSNLRRALTSESHRTPLKLHIDMISDTIDVNQLTDLTLAGASYAAKKENDPGHFSFNSFDEDEDSMEKALAHNTAGVHDSIMPLLIPKNIDAEVGIHANNILYSDLHLSDFKGRLLAFNGAVNLDSLRARSDFGSIDISALYTGLHPDDLRFGFGLRVNNFNLHRFLKLVPAIDSLLPVLRDFSGFISTDIAATVDINKRMDLVLPTLDAAVSITGDSLVLLDPDTFKSLSKWLLFKEKNKNMIDHMDVQMIVRDNSVQIYPFIFRIDRYKLGVQGANDFNMNFDYHIAVLKSPIPFKFGINISGNPDKYKIRLGGAKFGEKQLREVTFVDKTRINLMNEIQNVFKRGAREARLARLNLNAEARAASIDLATDTLTQADSLKFIQEGLIPAQAVPMPENTTPVKKKRKSSVLSPLALLTAPSPALYICRCRRRQQKTNSSQK